MEVFLFLAGQRGPVVLQKCVAGEWPPQTTLRDLWSKKHCQQWDGEAEQLVKKSD